MAHQEDFRELEGRIIELEARLRQPIPMHLFCPICHVQHFDPPGFRPHRTHTCQNCGHHWQPALVETVGVKFLPGCQSMPTGHDAYELNRALALREEGRRAARNGIVELLRRRGFHEAATAIDNEEDLKP